MAILTPLRLDDARTIGTRYGLDVAAVRGILAGSVNSNYELMLFGGGRVFLRIYEEQKSRAAAGEAALLDHLSAGGVLTPRPLSLVAAGRDSADAPSPRAFITEHADKPVALFPWVSGEVLCQRRVRVKHAAAVGQALARVHLVGASFQGAPPSRFTAARLDRRLAGISEMSLPGELARDVASLRRSLDRWIAQQSSPPPADGVIHGDLFRDNVLWENGAISALLDFESASQGSFAFDLIVTVLAWSYGDSLDLSLAQSLVSGYATVRPVPEQERVRLFDEACFAAIRFAITRITDFERRPKGRGEYRDYRRFLARLAEIERLGPGGLQAALGL